MAEKGNNVIQFPFRGRPRALDVVPPMQPDSITPEPKFKRIVVQPSDAPLISGPTGVREANPEDSNGELQFTHQLYELPPQHAGVLSVIPSEQTSLREEMDQ